MPRLAPFSWIVGIWVALLALGVWWIRSHPLLPTQTSLRALAGCLDAATKRALPGFVAKRALARNHWIGERDLDWASGIGNVQRADILFKYTTCAVKPGERVTTPETAALPAIEVPKERVSHLLRLASDPRLSSALNAGSIVDVWDGALVVARGLPVLAVQCPVPAPSIDCWAMVAAHPDDLPRLQQVTSALRVVAIAPTP